VQVAKWGNSLAIRIPASVVEVLQLKEGDEVDIYVEGKRSFAIGKAQSVKESLERLRRFRGRMPRDFKFDRLKANER
jgi:antitoxin MazE